MDAAAAASAATGAASTIAGQVVLVLLSLISTFAMLWKTTRDQNHALKMMQAQHEIAAAERREQAAVDQASREVQAAQIRERLAITGQTTSVAVATSAADVKEDGRLVTQLQTIELKAAIDQARRFMAEQAAKAYNEANDVNVKLKALHEANQKQNEVLTVLLRSVEAQQRQQKEVGR